MKRTHLITSEFIRQGGTYNSWGLIEKVCKKHHRRSSLSLVIVVSLAIYLHVSEAASLYKSYINPGFSQQSQSAMAHFIFLLALVESRPWPTFKTSRGSVSAHVRVQECARVSAWVSSVPLAHVCVCVGGQCDLGLYIQSYRVKSAYMHLLVTFPVETDVPWQGDEVGVRVEGGLPAWVQSAVIWKKDILLCVGVVTYGRHRGRIYIIFLTWGEGALIKLQYACISGSTRTCCMR